MESHPGDERRQTDHSEDPRQGGGGDQLPEEAPAGQGDEGSGPREPESAGSDAPDSTGGREDTHPGAPSEGSQSTGNPYAAG